MARYGEAALRAVQLLHDGSRRSPVDAWNAAMIEVFPNSKSSQSKGCPRGTFLGLCGSGFVAGVSAGDYTRSKKNKGYALRAIKLLRANPRLTSDEAGLWNAVISGETKVPNHQMEVVISLWIEGHIVP